MTSTFFRATAVCAALLVSLFAAPLFAADVFDAPPLTADPKALQEAAQKVTAANFDTVTLLDEATYSTESDGRTRTTFHLIELVVTADGVERAGTIRAPWSPWYDQRPSIQGRVIAKDGSIQSLDPKAVVEATAEEEADMFSDQRVLRAPLPGVVAGSIVETLITREGRSPIAGGGKFGTFLFGDNVPTEHSRLVLDAPASITPHVLNHANIEPRIVEKDGRRQTIFERGHLDATTEWESYLPNDEMNLPYIAFSTGTTWKEIAQHYSDIVDAQIANNDLKSAVANAIGKETDHRAMIDRLLAAVESNVRYAGVEVGDGSIVPRAPKTVLGNKYGDCKDKATLLVAMLRAAGINAHVALVHAGLGFDAITDLPGVDHFNHAIVAVDGEPALWIDPTDEFARAGELPVEDQGRMALIASPDTTAPSLTPQLPSTANVHRETREFTMPEDGKAHVVETTESTAARDAADRRTYATSDKTKYKEGYENYVKDYYWATSMEKLDVGDPHDLTKPFRTSVSVAKSQSGVVSASSGEIVIPTTSLVSDLPEQLRDYREQTAEAEKAKPSKKRVHDFVFAQPTVVEWTYRVILPAGFMPRTLPQSESLQLGTVTYTSDFKTEANGTIVANVKLDSGKRRLTAAEFEETRKAVSKFSERKGIRIGFDSIGQAKLNAGDVRAALIEFRKLAELHPKEAQHHIELARALLDGGLGEAARTEAKLAVTIEPSNAKAHAMLAEVLEHDVLGRRLRHGCDIPGAIAELRKAKQLESTNATYRGALADLLTYGDDDAPFGRNAHLKEAADEYTSLLEELGKDGKGYEPPLMLIYAHQGKWNDIKSSLDKIEEERQRELFRLIVTTVLDGTEAGVRALNAFDTAKRREHGTAVARTFLRLRMYPQAADFFEAATQGGQNASQLLPFVQILRKTKPVEQLPEDPGPRGLVMKVFVAALNDDEAGVKKFYVPEIANRKKKDEEERKRPGSALRSVIGDLPLTALLDITAAMLEVQQDGSDDLGYRLRLRMTGAAAAQVQVFYVVKRDGKYLIAGDSDPVDTVGISVLKMADEGKLEPARTWLNWVRETISAGGGDDPLSGPPFARLWQKEKQTATADEIRAAAAALMLTKDAAEDAAPVLEAARAKADREETKTSLDVALAAAYQLTKNWTKLLPIAERLANMNPDSGSAFRVRMAALMHLGRGDEARTLANERLARMPKDHEALMALSYASAKQGDYDAAATWARKIVNDLTPTSNDYNHAAWLALFRGKDFDQAIDDARKATSDNSWETLHTLAALYAETGKSTEARQALLKGIERRFADQPSSSDWFVLGRIAENYGVKDAAVLAYKKVKQDDNDGMSTWDLAQKRIAQLK